MVGSRLQFASAYGRLTGTEAKLAVTALTLGGLELVTDLIALRVTLCPSQELANRSQGERHRRNIVHKCNNSNRSGRISRTAFPTACAPYAPSRPLAMLGV